MTSSSLPAPAALHPAVPRESSAGPWRLHARSLVRGSQADPAWARPALLALLVVTGAAYLVGLTANGWANSFYSAAVQAGSVSWKAFFYGSSDAGSSITVDKPPASLWVMALSVRLLGLSSFAILLPQVLMGVATVGVVHASVRRVASHAAALLAGAVLALTPVAVLMFRFNNPDALLTMLMAFAAYAVVRAIASDRHPVRWMAAAGALIGLAFLTKALQAFVIVPPLGLAYLALGRGSLLRRVKVSAIALAALVVAGGWWVAIVELVPASARPWIGGSQDNSFLSVTFGYNGLGRLTGEEVGSVGGGNRGPNAGTESIWRLFTGTNAGQVSWLLPTALLLLVAGLALRGVRARTDLRRAAYVVWGGWLVTTALTFSLMAGIYHEYYTVALAPAIAAVLGIGVHELWERRATWLGRGLLALATAVTTAWAFHLLSRTTAYGNTPRVAVLVAGITATLLLLVVGRLDRRVAVATAAAAVVAGLVGPAAWSLTTVSTPHTGSIVTAGPNSRGGFGGAGGIPGGMPPGAQAGMPPGTAGSPPGAGTGTTRARGGMGGLLNASTPDAAVVAALQADASSYRWVAAAVGSQNAAGLQLGTGEPVMAIGGFNGSDPSPTLAEFQQYVADKQVHYFLSGGGFGRQNGGSTASSEIAAWVSSTFTQVTIGGQTFYDLTQPRA